MFSSEKDNWETPQVFFDKLNSNFHFTLDAAATKENTKCGEYLTNALTEKWTGRVFCNPPYGRTITGLFVQKAVLEHRLGNAELIVMLLPARTDTKWFHTYIYNKAEIRFLKGRLKFEMGGVSKDAAPFPSMLAIYKGVSI